MTDEPYRGSRVTLLVLTLVAALVVVALVLLYLTGVT
jgi:hypothetical protein